MKTKKHARILCLSLCLSLLFVSCGDKDDDTSSKTMESVEPISEYASELTSDTGSQAESFEESSEEPSKDESSEEPSKDESSEEPSEPDYQVEMTEEMANAFLKFIGRDETISEIMADLKKYEDTKDYNYKNDYIAFGNLGGYTFCYVSPGFGCSPVNFGFGQYLTPDYKYYFWSGCTGLGSQVSLYLYKDNTFITFEDGCEQGLVDVDKAYELYCAAGYSDSVKKLTEEEANRYREQAEKGFKVA